MEKSTDLIKYMDLFGTRCTFYSDRMPKLYTITGGIFTICSLFLCLLVFVIFSFDDLKRKFPSTTTSFIPSEGYRKIKFGEEKIWIPWRIVDYNNNEFVNHTGILYPIISYYSGIKYNNSKDYNMTKKILNYKLCNETSMIYESNSFQLTVPLNELYCIDMEDLDMGGSWITEFIYYIEFDLYYCEDGINYDETNPKCSTFNKIKNFIGSDNSLEIDIYYPVVQFQPTNKTFPVIIMYRNYFYHLSKYVNKINRIFLQENVLTDDYGWILKKEYNNSYWGLDSITGDSYYSANDNDLMNEGSTSRAYSFNLYLKPGIIQYTREYKKLYTIFSDFIPVAYFIFVIMKNMAKLFKKVENNKKMIELLFENLKEKQNIFEENLKRLSLSNNNNLKFNNKSNSKRNSVNSVNHKKSKNRATKERKSLDIKQVSSNINIRNSNFWLNEDNFNINNNSGKNSPSKNSRFYHQHKKSLAIINNNNININNNNVSNINLLQSYKRTITKTKANFNLGKNDKNGKNDKLNRAATNNSKNYIKQQLFPYKYYLYSVFIRNLNTPKENCLFSSRFLKIYTFFCQLFDITSYLSLHREFNALKQIINKKGVNLIEKNKKININSNTFMKDISDCIGEHKFYILAQGIMSK